MHKVNNSYCAAQST